MSVHRHTASSTMYSCFLERGKATHSPGMNLPLYMGGSYGGEVREKQMTPCLFIKGDDRSVATIKCVIAFGVL